MIFFLQQILFRIEIPIFAPLSFKQIKIGDKKLLHLDYDSWREK